MENLKDIENIERYINGDLSAAEVASFESQMASDPIFKEEVSFQQDLISSIQEARKADLKARLANIDVNTGLSTIQQVAIAAGTLLVGSLIYFGASNTTSYEQANETNPEVIEVVENTSTTTKNQTIQEEISPVESETSIDSEQTENTNIEKRIVESTPTRTEPTPSKERVITDITKSSTPQITTPSIPGDDEEDIVFDNINDAPTENSSMSVNSPAHIVPTAHQSKKDGYFYQYNKSNLDIYGDFEGKEYYLYELKETGKLYLSFNDKYYEIKETKSKTPFKEVADLTIIESLNKLR